ncbi:MAG: CGNR zinc finger domain-containing protein [Thiogranum sp.]
MIEMEKYADTLNLETGWLCLDFANTADWHASDHPEEGLNSYSDLVSWAQQVGVLADHQARQLLQAAAGRPVEAAAVLERAIALREAIYRIFSAVASGQPPQTADVVILNVGLSEALVQLRVTQTANSFAWEWADDENAFDRMLWPVVRSAAELLTSKELNRAGQCADDRGCGVLFFDTSRNRSRRWCTMKDCGNRAKAQRHYKRKRTAGPSSA